MAIVKTLSPTGSSPMGSPTSPMEKGTTMAPYQATIIWRNVFNMVVLHVGTLYTAVMVVPQASWAQLLVLWIGLWQFSGLGITAGAHRLWSHRSYTASAPLRMLLMVCNSMALQKSIFDWSRDHRVHHKASETDADPHNARRGFFFAHMGWLMLKKHPQVITEGRKLDMRDLQEDAIVMFQHRHYLPLVVFWCFVVPTVLGAVMFGDAWTGFWLGGVFRYVWTLHMTWCVNSVAHMWGDRPYAPLMSPAENFFVSLGAMGEGWHNYHHKYPFDYATGEWGITGQWNPTKLFIDVCVAFGLAWDVRRSTTAKATREENERAKAT